MLSSLIVYKFEENVFGLGSISTPFFLRKKGYASKLISQIIELLVNDHNATAIFLYSDIDSKFYEKFGFEKLPQVHQRYKETIFMVRVRDLNDFLKSKITLPAYF